jgi:mRNA interferase MazF
MPNTTVYNRGSVVLLPFPFSDQSTAKVRPAIVANAPHASSDLLVVAVSSVAGTLWPGEFQIRYWREAGLLHPSFGKRAIASVSANLVHKELRHLRAADLSLLDSALRHWFGI